MNDAPSRTRGAAADQMTNWQIPTPSPPPPSNCCLIQGSFLPVPDLSVFGDCEESISLGEVLTPEGEELEINKGRATLSISVTNMGDRPIQVMICSRVFVCPLSVVCVPLLVADRSNGAPPAPPPRHTRQYTRRAMGPGDGQSVNSYVARPPFSMNTCLDTAVVSRLIRVTRPTLKFPFFHPPSVRGFSLPAGRALSGKYKTMKRKGWVALPLRGDQQGAEVRPPPRLRQAPPHPGRHGRPLRARGHQDGNPGGHRG